MVKREALTCPQCGASIEISALCCEYCGVNLYFEELGSTFQVQKEILGKILELYNSLPSPLSARTLFSKGVGYLRLGMYELARKNFEETIELDPDCADAYFYKAVALLGGQRPRSTHLKNIRKVEDLLSAAIQLQPEISKYYFFLAVIKLDFYQANGLREGQPGANELMARYRDLNNKNDSKEVDAIINLIGLTPRMVYSQIENRS